MMLLFNLSLTLAAIRGILVSTCHLPLATCYPPLSYQGSIMATPKRLLKKELKKAEQELAQVQAQLEERPDFGLGTGSTGVFTWEMSLARRERIEEHIAEIQAALDRVDQGEYGICQTCGAKIDPERLKIVPCTTECAKCARKG